MSLDGPKGMGWYIGRNYRLPGLFSMDDDNNHPPENVVQLRDKGILPAQELREMIERLEIAPSTPGMPRAAEVSMLLIEPCA